MQQNTDQTPSLQEIVDAGQPPASAGPWPMLTARERELADLLVRGASTREAAAAMKISTKTGDTHRGHVLRKTGMRNNVELARFAISKGWTTSEPANFLP